MKIGIMTLPLIDNYGGILQNFALQYALRSLGHEAYTFDTCYRYSLPKYYLTSCVLGILQPMGLMKELCKPLKPYKGYIREHHCGRFVSDHIKTLRVDRLSEELIARNGIEAIIAGSDQIWRPKYNANKQCNTIYNSFLDFAENCDSVKKIAYAASFGVDKWEFTDEQTIKCRQLIQLFDTVSVRESTGIALCRDYLGRQDVEQMPDPTLLLDRSEYIESLGLRQLDTPNRNVVVYLLDLQPADKDLIIEHVEAEGLTPKFISVGKMSPAEWLEAILNAEYIITDSFHCSLLSILFHKPLHVIPSESRGLSRFENLFSIMRLAGNDFTISSFRELKNKKTVNYDYPSEQLKLIRERGINFLQKSLR